MIAAVIASVSASACAQESLLEPLNWVASADGVSRHSGISYGPDARQKLDVYRPQTSNPTPVIIFWHGGSWQRGDKDYYRFVGTALAERGITTVVANYRLAPEFPFPVFMRDAAMAVKWTRDHVAEFGGDPARLYLSGHSAGGHIALLLGLDGDYLSDVGLDRHAVAGIVAIAAPTGLEDLRGDGLEGVFPDSAPDGQFSPVSLARQSAAGSPPIQLISGADDSVIPDEHTDRLAEAIRSGGGLVSRLEYPGAGHLGVLLQFSALFDRAGGILDATARFAGVAQ